MNMNGESRIAAPREAVYAALNDVEVLQRAIPGCESIERLSDTEMAATVVARVGPVRAKFNGRVTFSDLEPPAGYTIAGEGKGGAAGFAKGSARVELEPDGEATIPALYGQGRRWRQAGPGRRTPDRRHGQEDGR